jgi:F-type H+-transporting ATPase subunit epsilon
MERIQLEIVTPDRRVLSQQVDEVVLPGQQGELGVLAGHTELISLLHPGRLTYRDGQTTESYAVAGGFVEVGHGKVVVLADAAEAPLNIDASRAEIARKRAEETLAALEMRNDEYVAAELALRRALTRIELAEQGRR